MHGLHAYVLAVASVGASCAGAPPRASGASAPDDVRVANLHAFARLYGVVRWFHPSDAAANADWDQLAVDGARAVVDAPDAGVLKARLEQQLAPIAPTMRIAAGAQPLTNAPELHPRTTAGLEVVAWQHEGFGDSVLSLAYSSKRLHREREVLTGNADALFLSLSQSVDASLYRGKRIRLRAKLRTAHHAQGRIWLRVENAAQATFFDNMQHRPVLDTRWHDAEITGPVADDATRIVFGIIRKGPGVTWYDDFDLAVQDGDGRWASVAIGDRGFEAEDPWQSWHPGTGRPGQVATTASWQVTVDRDHPAVGQGALRIAPETKRVKEELFASAPSGGETVDLDLGRGLRARVPIALYSDAHHTLGDGSTPPGSASEAAGVGDDYEPLRGLADVIVVWNALQHFWPYWDVVDTNWNAALDVALRAALTDRDVEHHVATLQRLLTAAPDGHAQVTCPGEPVLTSMPVALALAKDGVVVTASNDARIERGDVLEAIDGRPIEAEMAALAGRFSGTAQFRRVLALGRLGAGRVGSEVSLRVRRHDRELTVSLLRTEREVSAPRREAAIERLQDGVYYVDLGRAAAAELDAVMAELARAPGVVFDLRGYPTGIVDGVLSHLLVEPDKTEWEHVPRIIRPDSPVHPAEWKSTGYELPVLEPHLRGRIAFLIGAGTVSYAESMVGLIAHYKLGTLIGSTTAGVDGTIAVLAAPTGCSVQFTAARVTRLDGSRAHLVGFAPAIHVEPTAETIAAGRDEVLERGLDYVRTGR